MSGQDGDPVSAFPLKAPEPVPWCHACDRLACAGKLADEQGDPSRATDERVRLRLHLEAAHRVSEPLTTVT
ncbi:hypothetical protein ACFYQ5_30275 [Streptomyces sp. NPDC005794]|uniref:hypothetical protein n=1 Tax=Streptomyces sp. NPDC005794 TaxID=3364733 RepID=UPI00367EEABA